MKFVLCFLLLIAFALSQPTISDNFQSTTTNTRTFRNETHTHTETVYEVRTKKNTNIKENNVILKNPFHIKLFFFLIQKKKIYQLFFLFQWFTGRQRRIDTKVNNDNIVVYQFATNHTEYIDINGQHCMRREFYEPWIPAFDWVKNTKQNGTCSTNGKTGSLWVDTGRGGMDFTLCANGNTPIAFDVIDRNNQVLDVVYFNTFTSGVPAPSNFQLPARCYTRPF